MFKFERAKQLLEDSGRTRRWVARECGISEESLSSYLVGRRNPSLAVLKHMARIFEVTVDDLDDEITRRAVG
jgi:transcriptional regulator with XRE-family HTH domain